MRTYLHSGTPSPGGGHEENVRRLRGRIFKATKDGDWPTVRNLQKSPLHT
ncbi:reverse transcriptase N-terminal domain-containing protein [Micromonospora sp. ATA32]|nr:reverse transcriptase N-terminal domain-containing protein [Micromonospora sp. ATA32]